jgi:hypothetical protein
MRNTNTFHSSFMGIGGLDGDEVLIRYTRIGDLNLDGTVSIADFLALASNFNATTGATWQKGDVNYDGAISIADFLALAGNFGQSVSGDAIPIAESDLVLLNNFAQSIGASAVPEPTSIASLAAAGLLLSSRRRRNRR